MPSELVKCSECGDYYDFRLDEHNCKNDWISTGTMIDNLQVGQIAEAKNSEFTVIRGKNGQILVNNNPDYRYPLTLNFRTLEQQWRIVVSE